MLSRSRRMEALLVRDLYLWFSQDFIRFWSCFGSWEMGVDVEEAERGDSEEVEAELELEMSIGTEKFGLCKKRQRGCKAMRQFFRSAFLILAFVRKLHFEPGGNKLYYIQNHRIQSI